MAEIDASVCPKCGAPLDVHPGAVEVRCPYCGTLARVQAGERPRPEIAVAAPPVRASGASALLWVLPALISLGVAGATVARIAASNRASSNGGPSIGGLFEGRVSFDDTPMLADVNGDGVPDVVGHCDSGDTHYLAAFEGATGKLLWKGQPAPKEAFDGKRAIVGDLLVAVDGLGKVQATRIANGTPAWSGLISDKARSFCADGASVIIQAEDETYTRFDLATGKKSAADLKGNKRPACAPVYQTGGATPRYHIIDWPDFEANHLPDIDGTPGMSAHRALVPTTPGISFMLGSKDKGTSVAMVAAVEKGKAIWKDVVPGIDPLKTDVNVTTIVAASDGAKVVIPYGMSHLKDGVRMACFDARSGARLWDVQVHKASNVQQGITIEAGRVYYASWTALYVLSLADGTQLYELGHDF